MLTREEFEPSFTGQKRRNKKSSRDSAARLRYGSLRSPPLRRAAEHLPQSVTYAVRRKCYPCGEDIPTVALPRPRRPPSKLPFAVSAAGVAFAPIMRPKKDAPVRVW